MSRSSSIQSGSARIACRRTATARLVAGQLAAVLRPSAGDQDRFLDGIEQVGNVRRLDQVVETQLDQVPLP